MDGGAHEVEAYVTTSASSHIGIEMNPAEWTRLGATTITSIGADIPIEFPLGGYVLASGQSKGFYVTKTGGSGFMRYNSGTSSYTGGSLTIDMSVAPKGLAYPFGSVFSPRQWNGTICYKIVECEFDWMIPFDPIVEGVYQAYNSITSDGRVEDGADVTMEAMTYVDLMEDFDVELNAEFLAQTGTGCLLLFNELGSEKSLSTNAVPTIPYIAPPFQLVQQDMNRDLVLADFHLEKPALFSLSIYTLDGQEIAKLADQQLVEKGQQKLMFDLSTYDLKGNFVLKGNAGEEADQVHLNYDTK